MALMPRYEYLVSQLKAGESIDCDLFCKLGAEGWRLITFRPGVPEEPAADFFGSGNPGIRTSASTMSGVFRVSASVDQFVFMREIAPEAFPS